MTPVQSAGASTAPAELPAAATTTTPAAFRSLTACCSMDEQLPPPRLTLTTLAGVALAGTPGTASPPAQRMPSTVSDNSAPQRPDTRTGWIRAAQSTPAMPTPLLVSAPSTLATRVPCHVLLAWPLPS
ncbi:hypothetical protein D3C81_1300160 [compost metagenome]